MAPNLIRDQRPGTRRKIVNGDNLKTGICEYADGVAADVTGGAGDQYSVFRQSLHSLIPGWRPRRRAS